MGETILIVDDDPQVVRLLVGELQQRGYRAAVARDGIEAISVARAEKPQLVLLDVGLPAGDGFTVIERMRNLPDLSAIPVIVPTADSDRRERALAAGAAAFLAKPFKVRALLGVVEQTLRAAAHRRDDTD